MNIAFRMALIAVLFAGCDPGYDFKITVSVEASALPDVAADYPVGVAVRINDPNPNRVDIGHPVVLAFCALDEPAETTWEFERGGLGWCNGGLSATAWLGAIQPIQGVDLERRLSPGTRRRCESCVDRVDCVDGMRCTALEGGSRCLPISMPAPQRDSSTCEEEEIEDGEAEEAPACGADAPCPTGQGCSKGGCVPLPCDGYYYEMTPPTEGWTVADGPSAEAIQATGSQDMIGDPGSDGCRLEVELVLEE